MTPDARSRTWQTGHERTHHSPSPGVAVDTRHWIGGERVASAETFTDVSPIDGSTLGEIARGTATEADAAVAAAKARLPRLGRHLRAERARILHAIADGVEKRIEELAIVETTDNGALLRSHRRGVMPRVAHNFRFFADWLLTAGPRGLRDPRPHATTSRWDPAGPCVLITPWNAPLMLATWKVAPALAAGNTVVLKPAEWSPADRLPARRHRRRGRAPGRCPQRRPGLRLRDRRRADLAPGRAADQLHRLGARRPARSPRSAAANLTPLSPRTGRQVAAVGLRRRRPRPRRRPRGGAVRQRRAGVPGRHPPPRRGVGRGRVHRAGSSSKRRTLAQGDPRDEATDIGPNIHPRQLEKIDGFVQRAVAAGARAVIGGGPNTELGGLVLRADPAHRCRPGLGDRAGGGLRPGPDPADLRHRGRRRSASPTTPASAWPPPSPPATPSAPSASPHSSSRARSGSTASSYATCRRPSAAPATPASAARAAPGASTSTATSRTAVTAPNGWKNHG